MELAVMYPQQNSFSTNQINFIISLFSPDGGKDKTLEPCSPWIPSIRCSVLSTKYISCAGFL